MWPKNELAVLLLKKLTTQTNSYYFFKLLITSLISYTPFLSTKNSAEITAPSAKANLDFAVWLILIISSSEEKITLW